MVFGGNYSAELYSGYGDISHLDYAKISQAFYVDPSQAKPMTTVAAWQRFSQLVPAAGRIWLERVRAVDRAAVEAVVNEVPLSRMSSVCREFTGQLLLENQGRLLAGEVE